MSVRDRDYLISCSLLLIIRSHRLLCMALITHASFRQTINRTALHAECFSHSRTPLCFARCRASSTLFITVHSECSALLIALLMRMVSRATTPRTQHTVCVKIVVMALTSSCCKPNFWTRYVIIAFHVLTRCYLLWCSEDCPIHIFDTLMLEM